jgi:hypothetical protein
MRRLLDQAGTRRVLEVRGYVLFQRKVGRLWKTVRRFEPQEPMSADDIADFMRHGSQVKAGD